MLFFARRVALVQTVVRFLKSQLFTLGTSLVRYFVALICALVARGRCGVGHVVAVAVAVVGLFAGIGWVTATSI